jgi:N-acetylglucosaminyldiphosphoundecaprenol N-acetyl-beta-D-mannosaminyltransferase
MTLQREQRRILGLNFHVGDVHSAVERMLHGGLLVVPAAPALKDLPTNASYREAMHGADVAIADSAFMVMIWNFLQRDSIQRVSGLEYLHELLKREEVRRPGNTFWVMAGPASAAKNLDWLASQNIVIPPTHLYNAPIYGTEICDEALLEKIGALKPDHVVVTLGGGVQERLGHYLKQNLDYLPSIHCIGAAIAFFSGDQVRIPLWADRIYLGWLFRCLSAPSRYVPRYWSARQLLPLMVRYRSEPPVAVAFPSSSSARDETLQ